MKNPVEYPKRLLLTMLLTSLLSFSSFADPVQWGDIDANGTLDISDVTMLISYVLNDAGVDNMSVADMNGDGCLDVTDVTMLIAQVLNPEPQLETVTVTVNGVSFKMVFVLGNTFMMGSSAFTDPDAYRNESPVHEVTIWSYYIAETEVTQELWMAVMGKNPSAFQGDLKRPVENVSRFECARFVDKLTELTGKVFRMPTEAEWEYAARGAGYSRGFRFAGYEEVDAVAWYVENAMGGTQPVGMKEPNEIGLYDMSGNVFEWCQDFYSSYDAEPQVNPIGPESGFDNVIRGGAWNSVAAQCRVSFRGNMSPYEASDNVGLRLAMNY